MKKIIYVFLVGTLLLTGCGSDSTPSEPTSQNTEKIETTAQAQEEETESAASAVWVKEPSMQFERVAEMRARFKDNGDGVYHMASGYPQQFYGGDYSGTCDAIAVRVGGVYGIYDYEGNEIFSPQVTPLMEPELDEVPFIGTDVFGYTADEDRKYFQLDDSLSNTTQVGSFLTSSYLNSGGIVYVVIDGQVMSHNVFVAKDPYQPATLNTNGTNCILHVLDSKNYSVTGSAVVSASGEVLYTTTKILKRNESGDYINGFYLITDHAASNIFSYSYEPLIPGDTGDSVAFVNGETGQQITGFDYQNAKFFSDGYAPVKKNGKWGFINEEGKEVTDFIFDDVSTLYEGKTYVGVNGVYGILDLVKSVESGKLTKEACYPDGMPEGELATTQTDGSIGYVIVEGTDLPVRSEPNSSAKEKYRTVQGSTYKVYEIKEAGGKTWYRVGYTIDGARDWITGSEKQIIYTNGF